MPFRIAIIPTIDQSSAVNINYPYHTREVRDLAAACFSPPLVHIEQLTGAATGITACSQELTPARALWLERLDRDSSALLNHLSLRPTHRLGVYFEQLWHFFLQEDPATELVAHNLPVMAHGRTVGEFDCIYYCHRRACHVHLELAVKFYLGIPRTSNRDTAGYAHEWLGPDRVDRLDAKLDQLLHHQIRLGENPSARGKLHDLGIGGIAREVAIKGCLFRPTSDSPPLPPAYNIACEPGNWVSQAQLPSFCAFLDGARYVIVPRMKWLCAARHETLGETLDARQLQARVMQTFAHGAYPLLVTALDARALKECRFFVTPDYWPGSPERSE
jgi:uncharacterized protein